MERLIDDELKRRWVEVVAGDEMMNNIRSSLAFFMAIDRDGLPKPIGTGFVVSHSKNAMLVMTAKHVIIDGALNVQRPHSHNANSVLAEFLPVSQTFPSVAKDKLRAVWMAHGTGDVMTVEHVQFNEALDIAVCLLQVQENFEKPLVVADLPFDLSWPKLGDEVLMIAMADQAMEEVSYEHTSKNQEFKVSGAYTMRQGFVTGVHPQGLRHYKWPCFTTSIPASPGMSGGYVALLHKEDEVVAVCGVVVADNSEQEATTNFLHEGESIVAHIWPSFGLAVPKDIAGDGVAQYAPLHEYVAAGGIKEVSGDWQKMEIQAVNNKEYRVSWKNDA